MKISVDQSLCMGHAQCAANGPEVYTLDDDGYIALNGEIDVAPESEAAARAGAGACPERVITILD